MRLPSNRSEAVIYNYYRKQDNGLSTLREWPGWLGEIVYASSRRPLRRYERFQLARFLSANGESPRVAIGTSFLSVENFKIIKREGRKVEKHSEEMAVQFADRYWWSTHDVSLYSIYARRVMKVTDVNWYGGEAPLGDVDYK